MVFKLSDSLREVVDYPDAQIGQTVSNDLIEESLRGLRMPQDRQMRALLKGIEEFLSTSKENSQLSLRKIESNLSPMITTQDLEDTVIDVDIFDNFKSNYKEKESIPVYHP